ncbi:MAG: ATP-dependent Clp protease ATP-binding subunit, partial [Patescibacteria group bacterium]
MSDIVEKFTSHLKGVLTRALCLAAEMNKEEIQPEHLLWGIATEEGALGGEVLKRSGVNVELLQNFLQITTPIMSAGATQANRAIPKLSDTAKQVIEKAVLAANAFDHRFVGTEHLLIGIVQSPCIEVRNFFTITNIKTELIRHQLHILLSGAKEFPKFPIPDFLPEISPMSKQSEAKQDDERAEAAITALEYFCNELTSQDALERLDEVVGRDAEMNRVMEILSRRTKNNPVLVGEPGVGKTAVVEGIARSIVDGSAPAPLLHRRIFSLDLGAILAGTMYRGDFESRVKQIIEDAADRPEVILFVDEVHNLIGAGSTSGSLDAANMLKPALARGELRMIGATTPAEYKKYIETDRALERRLSPVRIEEPCIEDAVKMLRALVPQYSKYHGVRIPEHTIRFAAEISDKHIHGRRLPDKAIDLLDETASRIRLRNSGTENNKEIHDAASKLREVRKYLRDTIEASKSKEYAEVRKSENELEDILNKFAAESLTGEILMTPEDVAASVESALGLPSGEILAKENERWANLAGEIEREVFGQEHCTGKIAEHLRKTRLGLKDPKRPTGS